MHTIFSFLLKYTGILLAFILIIGCIQLYVDAQKLIGSNSSDATYWITLSKKINAENIGQKEELSFRKAELDSIQQWESVEEIFPITSNQFRVSADGGDFIPFYTELYFESVDTKAIDESVDIEKFKFKEGVIPIIVSKEYLNLYNYGFALNQGLPQISEDVAQKLKVNINIDTRSQKLRLKGQLVGFSDRIHSVLVPQEFLDSINGLLPNPKAQLPNRVLVKVTDAQDELLVRQIQEKGYEANKESLRSAQIKSNLYTILQSIILLGVFILVLSAFLIYTLLKNYVLQQEESMHIRYLLGHSPEKMIRDITRKIVITITIILILAMLIISVAQYLFSKTEITNNQLDPYLYPPIWLGLLIVPLLFYISLKYGIYKWLIKRWKEL